MGTRGRNLSVSLLILAAIAAGWWLSTSGLLGSRSPQYATMLPDPRPLPAFQLRRSDGADLTAAELRGRWTLLFFGFTHCPDICPATLQVLSVARQELAEAGQPVPDILLISVDPQRDTPEQLSSYVAHFGDGVSGATGPVAELRKLTGALGIYFEREESADTSYNVAHSPQVIVVNDDGHYAGIFGAPHRVDTFTTDLPIIMN